VPEHRIRFMEGLDPRLDGAQLLMPGGVDAEGVDPRELLEDLLVAGQELVQRRIEEPDRHGMAVHGREDADEVLPLKRQQPVDGLAPRLLVERHDHLADDGDAVFLEEHVLGPNQADALGLELARFDRVVRCIGIGAHAGRAHLAGPVEQLPELRGQLRIHEGQRAQHDLAGRAVQRHGLSLAHDHAARAKETVLLVHHHVARTHHTALAPPTGDHGRVRGQAAAGGQHALRGEHPGHVLRGGLLPDEDGRLLAQGHLDGFLRIEYDLADGGGGRGREPARDGGIGRLRIDGLDQELIEGGGLHAQKRGVPIDEPLPDHLDRDANGGAGSALARARL